MAKLKMTRKAADSEYRPKDFHGALNLAMEYLRTKFGADAARDYLRQYAESFHAPLTRRLRRRGLAALKEYFKKIYAIEGAPLRIDCTKDELRLETDFCPAVKHIRKMGQPLSPLFIETERVIYTAICENTPFAFELVRYDRNSGGSIRRFYSASQPKALLRRRKK